MNGAARVVSDTGKFDRGLKAIFHDQLHWLESLDVAETIDVTVMVHQCLHGQATRYLADHGDHLIPASEVAPCRRHRI